MVLVGYWVHTCLSVKRMESSHGYSVMKDIAGVLIDRLVKLPLNLQDHSLSATQPLPVGIYTPHIL